MSIEDEEELKELKELQNELKKLENEINELENDDSDNDEEITFCDNCNKQIILAKNGYYILTKKDVELCWCQNCFENLWKEMRDNFWECDDFEQYNDDENEDENV